LIDDAAMRNPVLVWVGAGVTVTALGGLGFYFAKVGLAEADQLASVLGLFVAVAGLGVAIYGLRAGSGGGGNLRQEIDGGGNSRIFQAGRDIKRPSAQPKQEWGDRGIDDASSGGTRDDAPRHVQQRVTAREGDQIYQAGRDLDVNHDDEDGEGRR
jgi:hypothetical protein